MDAKTRDDGTSWPNWARAASYGPPAFGTIVSGRAGLPYRADIDGLRAVAVLLVVGFHAFRSSVPGGFVGVDIFFVISGFLITGIILDAQEKCTFSFRQFYMRRIRRIFPALIIVLTFTFLTSWYLLLPDKMISLGRNLFGGAFFLSNIVLLNETGYFDIAANEKPLLHLWSLGVEEQFYIFWPLVAWSIFRGRHRRRHLLRAACILTLGSCALNVILSYLYTAAAFYLPITRIWEILTGAVLAILPSERVSLTSLRLQNILQPRLPALGRYRNKVGALADAADFRSLLGIGLILISVAVFSRDDVFPGWRALLPVLGTVLLISGQHSWTHRALSHPAFVYVGLVSYPFYLWHWPLLCFARSNLPKSQLLVVGVVILSFALACGTYHFIEKPLRAGKPQAKTIYGLCAVMVAIGCLGVVTIRENGFDFRVPAAVRNFAHVTVEEKTEWRLHRCLLESNEDSSQFSGDCVDQSQQPLVFLWGDSVAAALYPGLRDNQQTLGYGLAQFTIAGCPPILGFKAALRPYCKDNNEFVASEISKYRPDIVILHSAWAYEGLNLDRLAETVANIRSRGAARIVELGPPLLWDGDLPLAVIQYYWNTGSLIPEYSKFKLADIRPFDGVLREKAARLGIEYLSVWDIMCNEDGCRTRVGSSPDDLVAFDRTHLTLKGSRFLANRVMRLVLGH
jgi:peptidoglycan/LPS O-acetylase OafA/YrhL